MKNAYEIRGDITAIIINSRKYGRQEALISTNKLPRVMSTSSWHVQWDVKCGIFYSRTTIPIGRLKYKSVPLHRFLTDAPDEMQVDHIDHNGLNNTDENLRILTPSENQQNKIGARKGSKSGVSGVTWDKYYGRWFACITVNKKTIYLGRYTDVREA